jgi:hypothetical protein
MEQMPRPLADMPIVTALRVPHALLAGAGRDPLLSLRELDARVASRYGRNHCVVVGLDLEHGAFGTTPDEFVVNVNPPELPA